MVVLSLLTIGIYAIYWLGRLHQELPRRQGRDMSGRLWTGVFTLLTVLMIALFAISGYSTVWLLWGYKEY